MSWPEEPKKNNGFAVNNLETGEYKGLMKLDELI